MSYDYSRLPDRDRFTKLAQPRSLAGWCLSIVFMVAIRVVLESLVDLFVALIVLSPIIITLVVAAYGWL